MSVWLLAMCVGFLAFGAYHASPSRPGAAVAHWPSGTGITLDRSLPTLLIFIHPRCPCSLASLDNLDRLASQGPGRFAAQIVAHRPEAATSGWDVPAGRAKFPEWVDLEGREAARFGVESSGHVLLFDPSGRRLFSGGITISRGHRGDNPGLDRLNTAIRGGPAGVETSPVFGCPILDPSEGLMARPRS